MMRTWRRDQRRKFLQGRSVDSRRRGGLVVLEFIVVMPILFLVTLAAFEFGILLLVHQAVTTAAIEGVREAAKVGATVADVENKVDRILGVHCVEVDDDADDLVNAQLIIQQEQGLVVQLGDTTLCSPPPVTPSDFLDGRVRVTVCVPVTDMAGCTPVPDWLSYVGLSWQGKVFMVSSLAELE